MPPQYEVRSRLGEGGFGEVYEAWDHQLRRSVAIKRLKNLGDTSRSEHLLKEARLAASLQHAAFVKIYGFEDERDNHAIVMELVRGQTLKQMLANAPCQQELALAIMRQLAAAMCEAHDSGLMHGDLKPSNLMLEPSGSVRILDFGLAAHCDPQATASLSPLEQQGTIAYMAPERLLGAPLQRQSDIYALGVILYELLTGTRPFAGLTGLALAAAHVQSTSEQWEFPATLAPELVQLVRAMTAHPAARRLQTMQQVCDHLAMPGAALAAGARPARRFRRHAQWAAALALLSGGAWLALPYLPSATSLATLLAPYSEAREMQRGLQALGVWDRPGALVDAEQRFTTVLEHSPQNAAAVAGLALVYSLRYGTDHQDEIWLRKADAAAQQALHLNPQLAISHLAQASVLVQQGRYAPALVGFERALTLDPDNVLALYGKVGALRHLRRYEQALGEAEANLRRHPGERLFADQVGSIHYAQAHYQEAEKAFRRSIQVQPDAVLAYANLSAALASQNRSDEALHALQQGLQVRPSAWLYTNLGNTLFLRGDYGGAAAAFEAALAPDKGNPADYLAWANLADTLLWIPGRTGEARRAYARASELLAPRLARSPDDVTLVSRMALYFARSGDKDRSSKLLQHALALAPNSADLRFRAGLAYELVGERKLAVDAINAASALGYPIRFVEAAPELVALRRDPGYAPRR